MADCIYSSLTTNSVVQSNWTEMYNYVHVTFHIEWIISKESNTRTGVISTAVSGPVFMLFAFITLVCN